MFTPSRRVNFSLRSLFMLMSVAALLAAVWRFAAPCDPVTIPLPDDKDVAQVTALLYEDDSFGKSVPEFVIPDKYLTTILSTLRPAQRCDYPDKWDEWHKLGQLRIHCRDRRIIEITWPSAGHNALCFQVDGTRCARGGAYNSVSGSADSGWVAEGELLRGIVWEVHRELVTGQPSKYLPSCIEDMERSRGTRFPR